MSSPWCIESLEGRRLLSGVLFSEPDYGLATAEETPAPVVELAARVGTASSAPAIAADAPAERTKAVTYLNKGKHPFFPLIPGYKWEYTDGRSYRVVRTITNQTKTIAGVSTRVMLENHYDNGRRVEIWKWYLAINRSTGDLNFFGESSKILVGLIWATDSWFAGENGNPIGTLLPGQVKKGVNYTREEADDEVDIYCRVDATNRTVRTPAGTYTGCAKIFNYDQLILIEQKDWYTTYAPGVGEIVNTYYGFKLAKFTKG